MIKKQWTLHIDLLSWDPKEHQSNSAVNLHLYFDSEKEMDDAFVMYHSLIGERMTLKDMYTIVAVEPDLYPTDTETAD